MRTNTSKPIGGRVTSAGAVSTGMGYSVRKTGTGTYNVIITRSPFKLLVATASSLVPGSYVTTVGNYSGNQFTVYTFASGTGASTDADFGFIAIQVD